jgi:AcrR family transcriptional regulator
VITEEASSIPAGSTRDRLVDAALELFAAQGFRSTTVGQIEAAAGLQPRRGALYKHFGSKAELLEAVARRHVDSVREGTEWIFQAPVGDVRTEATVLGRFAMDELERQRVMVNVLERDGDRIPELRDLFRERASDAAYRTMVEILRRWVGPDVDPAADLETTAVLLLGGLINAHRSEATFGALPIGRTQEQVLAAWADQCARTVGALRRSG